MTRVKVCGMTRKKDALLAARLGAHAVGFIFHRGSPRFVPPERAARILESLPPFVASVGVFVNASAREIRETLRICPLSAVQLHGEESPAFCRGVPGRVIKAFRVRDGRLPRGISRYAVDALLLDTYRAGAYGGTGEVFDWEVARRAGRYGRIILAGGLNPSNVRRAVETVRPFAVDVSSGVETAPGRKDPGRLEAFFRAVNRASVSAHR